METLIFLTLLFGLGVCKAQDKTQFSNAVIVYMSKHGTTEKKIISLPTSIIPTLIYYEDYQNNFSFNAQQYSTGIIHVFVNGVRVLKDGEHTGALPGKVVRGPGFRFSR